MAGQHALPHMLHTNPQRAGNAHAAAMLTCEQQFLRAAIWAAVAAVAMVFVMLPPTLLAIDDIVVPA